MMKEVLGFLGARPGGPDATIPGMTGRPAAHIQARIWKGDKKLLTTECFIKGFASNEQDGQFKQIRARDPKGCEMLCPDFAPLKRSKIDELAAKWDIVLGYTPEA